jgi:hypothetical protein
MAVLHFGKNCIRCIDRLCIVVVAPLKTIGKVGIFVCNGAAVFSSELGVLLNRLGGDFGGDGWTDSGRLGGWMNFWMSLSWLVRHLASMGAYKYISELYKKKQSDVLRFLLRVRYVSSSSDQTHS